MKNLKITLIIAIGSLLFANKVQATTWGKDERLHKIETCYFTENNDTIYLGFKTSSFHVFAGLYVKDDGYILQQKTEYEKYIPLTDTLLKELQKEGKLPAILPKYKIPISDYLIGYSFWIIILCTFLYFYFRKKITGKSLGDD